MKNKKPVTIEDSIEATVELRKAIGRKIKGIRKQIGHSAELVAGELGITREALTHIETGRNNITAVSLWKLACLFNCKISDFFPTIPGGYSLSKVDLTLLAREDERAAEWAKKLFKTEKIKS